MNLKDRDTLYMIVNASLDFRLNDNLKVAAGVNKVFDERPFRTGGGVNTFNEPEKQPCP